MSIVVTSLAALKAASVSTVSQIYQGALFTWTTGDFSEQADDTNVVKSDNQPLSSGAWLRQSASALTFRQTESGSVLRRLEAKARDLPLLAADFGVAADGATDDTAALQAAIDAAASQNGRLILPPGQMNISSSLDLKGRKLTIEGQHIEKSMIVAAAAMTTMLDIADASDDQFPLLELCNFTLWGANLAGLGYDLRHRHNTSFRNLRIFHCETGLRERDGWNNYRENVRVVACITGMVLAGSNHATAFVKCGVNDADNLGLYVAAAGSAPDGNQALKFDTCNFDFNAGRAIQIDEGTNVLLENCYIGENGHQACITNYGRTIVRSGSVFVGYTSDHVIRAAKGSISFEGVKINGQGNETLISLFARSDGDSGTASYQDCEGNINTQPIAIPGAPFGRLPGRAYSPTLGRNFELATFGGAAGTVEVDGDAAILTVTSAPTGGILSLWVSLENDWSRNDPAYLVPIYTSDMNAVARLSTSPLNANQVLSNLPSTDGTLMGMPILNIENLNSLDFNILEYTLHDLQVGKKFKLHYSYFSDSRFQNRRGAQFSNLGIIG